MKLSNVVMKNKLFLKQQDFGCWDNFKMWIWFRETQTKKKGGGGNRPLRSQFISYWCCFKCNIILSFLKQGFHSEVDFYLKKKLSKGLKELEINWNTSFFIWKTYFIQSFSFSLETTYNGAIIFPPTFHSADKPKMPLFTNIYAAYLDALIISHRNAEVSFFFLIQNQKSVIIWQYGTDDYVCIAQSSKAQTQNFISVPWWYDVACAITTVRGNKNSPSGFKKNVYYLLSAF